jgi:electron transfer flavoprotein beta subunit
MDARAVEMGLRLVANMSGSSMELLHAGNIMNQEKENALRAYLGMGVERLKLLRVRGDDDVVPALTQQLSAIAPGVILTGQRAAGGEDSGMVPYLIAESLHVPIVAQVVDAKVSTDGKSVIVVQALPRGRRREVELQTPCVLAVAMGAPSPRASAYARAQRGAISATEIATNVDQRLNEWQLQPARPRGKRLRASKASTAATRLQAATIVVASGGAVLQPDTPLAAAQAILQYLRGIGMR